MSACFLQLSMTCKPNQRLLLSPKVAAAREYEEVTALGLHVLACSRRMASNCWDEAYILGHRKECKDLVWYRGG